MRALGGADLDGDEAWFFMGGKRGFKKSWKDAFANNKREFYKFTDGKKTILPQEYDALPDNLKKNFRALVGDNKTEEVIAGTHKGKTHSEVLENQLSETEKARDESFESLFSPVHRAEVS